MLVAARRDSFSLSVWNCSLTDRLLSCRAGDRLIHTAGVQTGNGQFPWTIAPRTVPLPCSVRVTVRSGVSKARVGLGSVGLRLGLIINPNPNPTDLAPTPLITLVLKLWLDARFWLVRNVLQADGHIQSMQTMDNLGRFTLGCRQSSCRRAGAEQRHGEKLQQTSSVSVGWSNYPSTAATTCREWHGSVRSLGAGEWAGWTQRPSCHDKAT